MRKWNRTFMEWNCHLGLKTDIEVTDMEGAKKSDNLVHTLQSLSITSLPGARRALVETMILRCVISPTNQRQAIVKRFRLLEKETGEGVFLSGPEWLDSSFRIVYGIPSGQRFCDWAIEYVRKFHHILGVEDPNKFRQAEFEITQQTFVFYKDQWVDFAWWLRQEVYHLPQVYECEIAKLDCVLV